MASKKNRKKDTAAIRKTSIDFPVPLWTKIERARGRERRSFGQMVLYLVERGIEMEKIP